MNIRLLCGIVAVSAALGMGTAYAAPSGQSGQWQYPVTKDAGRIRELPHSALQPDKQKTYKVVFDVKHGGGKAGEVNKGLAHVARTVNLFAAAGVPLDHLHFAVIFHGAATVAVMKNAAFKQRTGTANPNLKVISELKKTGVKLYVCGQALAENHIQQNQVDPKVTIALSALTSLIELQQQGYVLMPL
jgi:intracellular sulfur oxidation DsrE/DsrF family protein